MDNIIKRQRLANDIRVVIVESQERGKPLYIISAQQYLPKCSYYWEVHEDGWRDTMTVFSASLEGAKRQFESMVRQEQRYVESRRH